MPDNASPPTAPALAPEEVKELVGAIQSVQQNIQRRAEQSYGAITILWGVIVFFIMMFYQNLEVTDIPWLHAMADYAWLMFVTIGLLATGLVGSSFDRAATGPPRLYPFWHTIIFVAIGTIAVVALISADQVRRIPGFWVLFFPVFNYDRHRGKRGWSFAKALTAIAVPLGIFLLIWSPWFSWTIGGLFYLIGLGVLGWKAYRQPQSG